MNLWKLLGGGALVTLLHLAPAPATFAAEGGACDLNDRYCHRFVKAEQYYREINPDATDEDWAKMQALLRPFTDPASMTAIMADPARLTAWMTGLTDPDAIHLMMRCSQEPIMWNTWLKVAGNPVKLAEAMIPFFYPSTYINWIIAPVNPKVYAGFGDLVSADYYADWGNKAGMLTFYEPLWSWVDPQWTVDRLAWLVSPEPYASPFQWLLDSMSEFSFASK
jgi:hypothetical protein